MMQELDKRVMQELGATIGNLTIENSALKVQLDQAQRTAHTLAERLKKYENEDGVPHGSTGQCSETNSEERSKAERK